MKYYVHHCFILIIIVLFQICLTNDSHQQCSIRDSCLNSSLLSPSIYNHERLIQSRNCFCDSICYEYGDCCHDYQSQNSIDYECVDFLTPTFIKQASSINPLFIWMRTKCLPVYVGSYSDLLCRNLNNDPFDNNSLLYVPVTSLKSNVTYRNYYCAYCNDELNENIQFWEYRAYCSGSQNTLNSIVLPTEEQIHYYLSKFTQKCLKTIVYPQIKGTEKPSVFIRPCKHSLETTCPMGTASELAKNCSTYGTAYRYKRDSNTIYRNIYCAKCRNINENEITCIDPYLRSSTIIMDHIRMNPLSILFDPHLIQRSLEQNLQTKNLLENIYSLSYNCTSTNEYYNLFFKKCFHIKTKSKYIFISMTCSYDIDTTNDYIPYSNGSIYINKQKLLLNPTEYSFLNRTQIVFCNQNLKEIQINFPIYRNILSIICTIISLICLIIFFVIFYLIPSLHNLPGQCVLFLSISIFIGQSLFFLASNLFHLSLICFISSILIHYFYLSSFFWLFIIALHIHSTFNRRLIENNQTHTEKSRLLIYNICVWFCAAIIVLISYLIELIAPYSNFSPNYGNLFCSISKSNAMIVFFIFPIGFSIVLIIILFIRTIFSIYRTNSIAKFANSSISTNNNSNRKLLIVYVRLASLMGLQWLLLLVALVLQRNWIWILFEIINSLPGIFICFGFLHIKKLWINAKQKLTIRFVVRRQSSRSNVTSTISMSSPLQREK